MPYWLSRNFTQESNNCVKSYKRFNIVFHKQFPKFLITLTEKENLMNKL